MSKDTKSEESIKSYLDVVNETFNDTEKETRMEEEMRAKLLAQEEERQRKLAEQEDETNSFWI